jgi:hypothetical protein
MLISGKLFIITRRHRATYVIDTQDSRQRRAALDMREKHVCRAKQHAYRARTTRKQRDNILGSLTISHSYKKVLVTTFALT